MSSANSVSTDNTIAQSVKDYAEEVTARRDAQAGRYEQAKLQTNVWTDKKNTAHRNLAALKAKSNGKKTSELSFALANYNTTCSSYRDAEINEEIARDSYRGAIFFAGKINQQAAIV